MKKVFCIPSSTIDDCFYSEKTIGEVLFSGDEQLVLIKSEKVGDYTLCWRSDSNQYNMRFGSCLPCKGLVVVFKENDTIEGNGEDIIRNILSAAPLDRKSVV